MSNDAPRRGASFSSAFSIILSLARERVAELGCPPVGENPKAFVDRGGLSRLETDAAEAAIRRVREAAYPLIFKLFGSKIPRGKPNIVMMAVGSGEERIGLKPSYLAADTAYGTGKFLAWTIGQNITPHITVKDRSERTDGTFSRSDFSFDKERK